MKAEIYQFVNGVYFIPRSGLLALGEIKENDNFNGLNFRLLNIPAELDDKKNTVDLQNLVEARRHYFKCEVDQLSIVPNTECHGRCSYCYAKSARTTKEQYLTPERLLAAMSKINLAPENTKSVIIYGGEPLIDADDAERLIELFPKTNVNIVTSLFYSDENLDKVKLLLDKYKNLTLCISIDPKSDTQEYNRKYPEVEDTYEFLVLRASELKRQFDKRIFFRVTIDNNTPDFSSLLNRISEISETKVTANVELVEDYEIDMEIVESLKKQIVTYQREHDVLLAPAKRFTYDPLEFPRGFINIWGDCDQLFHRVSINFAGEIHGCSATAAWNKDLLVDLEDESRMEELKDQRTRLWDKCIECNFVNLCGGLCYYLKPTESRCEWRKFNILEGIFQSLNKLTPEELKQAIELNNKTFIGV